MSTTKTAQLKADAQTMRVDGNLWKFHNHYGAIGNLVTDATDKTGTYDEMLLEFNKLLNAKINGKDHYVEVERVEENSSNEKRLQ